DAGGGLGLAVRLLPAFDIQRVVNGLQRAVVAPRTKIVVHRAARRRVFQHVAPLAAGAQDIHHAIDHLAHVDTPLAAATLRRRYQRRDMFPFRVREIAWIAQLVTAVAGAVLGLYRTTPANPHLWKVGERQNV